MRPTRAFADILHAEDAGEAYVIGRKCAFSISNPAPSGYSVFTQENTVLFKVEQKAFFASIIILFSTKMLTLQRNYRKGEG